MKISDLKIGDRITIIVYQTTGVKRFIKRIVKTDDDSLTIDPLKDTNGNPIELANTYIDMMVLKDNIPFLWKNVIIENTIIDTVIFNKITQTEQGKIFNRRNAYRYKLNCPAKIFVGLRGTEYDVTLCDISATGFAISINAEIPDLQPDTYLRIIADLPNNFHYDQSGFIVREFEDNKSYGCMTSGFSHKVDEYISLNS